VPEIALTPQLVSRFRSRFGDGIVLLHSQLSQGERYDGWRRIRNGLVKIAIGARSAIFAPSPRSMALSLREYFINLTLSLNRVKVIPYLSFNMPRVHGIVRARRSFTHLGRQIM
jgi:hypothetical protein